MAPQVETQKEKNHYRVQSLTPERYRQLLAIKEVAEQTTPYTYAAPYCAGPCNGPDSPGCEDGFDYEVELIEATRALTELFDLLHKGHVPGEALDKLDWEEEFWISRIPGCDILGLYRTFRLTGRICTWERFAAIEKRVELTRSTVRWRLQGSTIREIAERQVLRAFPHWFPNSVSRETIRRILVRYGLHMRGFQITEQTYRLCREDELCVERVLMAHVRRNGGYLPPLSEKNGAVSRTRTRDQLVTSNLVVHSDLNWREKRRKWLQDLKRWVTDVAPRIRSQSHAREVFIKKMDEWFADPIMSEMFLVQNLKGVWVADWISTFEPDFLESCLRKRLEYILSSASPDTILRLGLEEARRNWNTAKRMLAKAIRMMSPAWL